MLWKQLKDGLGFLMILSETDYIQTSKVKHIIFLVGDSVFFTAWLGGVGKQKKHHQNIEDFTLPNNELIRWLI